MTFRINYSIIFVSDMQRSVAFYRDIIGIPLKFQSPDWTEFSTEGATLALHKGDEAEADKPSQKTEQAGQCRAGFQVENLHTFHQRVSKHGVVCLQEPRETFGVWIAQYADPDGLIFSVSGENPGG